MRFNKKGSMGDLMLFGLGVLGVLLVLGLVFFVIGKINLGFVNVGNSNAVLQTAVAHTWSPFYTALANNVNLISFGLIFGMILLFFITLFLAKLHPAFTILYLLFWIIAIFFSVTLSNTFATIQNTSLSVAFNAMPIGVWIMNNLVSVIVALGVIGGIILFVDINNNN